MAAALEMGGMLSMTLGLLIAYSSTEEKRGKSDQPSQYKYLDLVAAVVAILGVVYSFFHLGLSQFNQALEVVIVSGFLIGAYLLAIQKPAGYLFFILMCGSNTWLMLRLGYVWLALQQIISILLIFDAYVVNRSGDHFFTSNS